MYSKELETREPRRKRVMRWFGRQLSSRNSVGLVVLGVFYLYLGFHTLSGNQGLLRWVDYEGEVAHLTADIETLKAERGALELHAGQLRAEHLNLDRLDEESRRLLNVSNPKEYVIWLDEPYK